ncbi:hypothetical protein BH11PSE13_BH11PSE13_04400 [soil metagenome]
MPPSGVTAKTKLTINGGTSYGEYSSGNITQGTTGRSVNHAASHSLVGPDSRPTKPVNGEACATKEHIADSGGNSVSR